MEPRFELADSVLLRPVEEADVDELCELIDANRAYLACWMPWAAGQTRETTLSFLRGAVSQLEFGNGFQAALVVDGELAGTFGFHEVDWQHRRTSIGYWISERHQGRGLATRAVSALIDHAFGTWELHRVEIRAAVDNARSRALCERLGMAEEGVLREAERLGERYHDLVVYSLLAPDWPTGATSSSSSSSP